MQAELLAVDAGVKRQDDAGIGPELPEGLRKAGHHVAKTPALGVGRTFRGDEQHAKRTARDGIAGGSRIHCVEA